MRVAHPFGVKEEREREFWKLFSIVEGSTLHRLIEFFGEKTSEEIIDCGDDFGISLEVVAMQSFLKDQEQPVIAWSDVRAIFWMCHKLVTVLLEPLLDQTGCMQPHIILVKHPARLQFWVLPADVLFQFL